jgi:hypothetical protein
MITFTVSSAGESLLANATAGTNPVLIDSIVLSGTGDFSGISPVTNFAGAVVASGDAGGDYVVVTFDDTTAANTYTIQQITLKSGNTTLATSEAVSLTKTEGRSAFFRVSCQFNGASKCSFQNTNINLPYASQSRDGVIRLARTTGETHKSVTVYSAADTDTLIASAIGDSTRFVPWDLSPSTSTPIEGHTTVSWLKIESERSDNSVSLSCYYDENTQEYGLNIDEYVYGDAVTTAPYFEQGGGLASSQALITESYVSDLYSNAVLVGSPAAATNKLVSGSAVDSYVTSRLSSIDSDYVHITGAETISGAKTFSAATTFTNDVTISGNNKKLTAPEVSSTSYTGTGVYSTYASGTGTGGWGNSSSNAKIPTVQTVRSAIGDAETSITSAYQTADSGLQTQIDALNAGQNLADIVATKAALDTLPITNLQTGDKVQVLADETHDGASTVYNLTSTSPKTWTYIGKYGQDSYTKSEADNLFVENSQIKQSVDSTKQDEIPSSSAVASYVSTAISTASGDYVKLSSQTAQTVTSDLDITGDVDITGQLDVDNLNLDGSTIVSYSTGCGGQAYRLNITNSGYSAGLDYMLTDDNDTSIAGSLGIVASLEFHSDLPGSPAYTELRVRDYYIQFTSTGSGANKRPIVSGDFVADYSDITPTAPQTSTDGRLVTVDYMNSEIAKATPSGVAYLAQSNTFTGATNTFNEVSATSYTGTGVYSAYVKGTGTGGWSNSSSNSKIPTVATVRSAIADSQTDTLNTISEENAVGSIGLFLYTEVGAQKSYGEFVNGIYLKPVGMSLPISGQITYKSVATTNALSGKWKLLSVAMKRTATEPCLVLAQKVDANYSNS